ncbi:MAG: hypothetical protein AB2L09_13345, partial [Coriobacteriia bacterium]
RDRERLHVPRALAERQREEAECTGVAARFEALLTRGFLGLAGTRDDRPDVRVVVQNRAETYAESAGDLDERARAKERCRPLPARRSRTRRIRNAPQVRPGIVATTRAMW